MSGSGYHNEREMSLLAFEVARYCGAHPVMELRSVGKPSLHSEISVAEQGFRTSLDLVAFG